MSSLTTALARRGMEAAHSSFTKRTDDADKIEISGGSLTTFVLTALAFLALFFAVSYTYGSVVATLCMIEEPGTNEYIPVNLVSADETAPPAYSAIPDNNTPKQNARAPPADDLEVDEALLVHSQPITSSLRASVQHLQARAGRWSRFRGLSAFLCFNIVRGLVVSALATVFKNRIGLAIAAILGDIILSRWAMTWVHIVISEPSPKKWYQRIPPLYTWKRIAPAVALQSTAQQIVQVLPMLVCQSFGPMKHLRDPAFESGKRHLYQTFGQSFMGLFLVMALYLLLEIPASVMMVRVAASMLPDEDETIVPFDRTFGGKVTPALVGGSGRIGIFEAWRSFTWASRTRLLKLIAKVFLILFVLWAAFSTIFIIEAHIILGDKIGEFSKLVHHQAGQH